MFEVEQKIKNVLFDVDGVFTDGSFYYSADGKILKKFGPEDGDGIRFLKSIGVKLSAISADHRGFEITRSRMSDLKIPLELVSEPERHAYISQHFDLSSLAFVADGIFDAKSLGEVRCGIAPSNASRAAKRAANFITSARGGEGAVAEAAFFIGRQYFPSNFENFIVENGFNETDF